MLFWFLRFDVARVLWMISVSFSFKDLKRVTLAETNVETSADMPLLGISIGTR
jgi:hypothetical protein